MKKNQNVARMLEGMQNECGGGVAIYRTPVVRNTSGDYRQTGELDQ